MDKTELKDIQQEPVEEVKKLSKKDRKKAQALANPVQQQKEETKDEQPAHDSDEEEQTTEGTKDGAAKKRRKRKPKGQENREQDNSHLRCIGNWEAGPWK